MVQVDTRKSFFMNCTIHDSYLESNTISLHQRDVADLIPKLQAWLVEYDKLSKRFERMLNEHEQTPDMVPANRNTLIAENKNLLKPVSATDKYKTQLQLKKSVHLPGGFEEIWRTTAKRNGFEETTYVYGKNARGVYGYKVFNGKESPFRSVGRIQNPNSTIGSFLRAIPMYQKLIMSDLLKLGVITNGRRLKAVVDILLVEGYLQRTPQPLINRRGVYGYTRTLKKDGLEVESNGRPAVSSNPTELKAELPKALSLQATSFSSKEAKGA